MPTTGSLGTRYSTLGGGLLLGAGPAATGPPTTATLSGPTSGYVGEASTSFTIALDAPADQDYGFTLTLTGGGTLSDSTPTVATGQSATTFTYTPATAGSKSIALATTSGLTLSGTPASYSASVAPALAYYDTTLVLGYSAATTPTVAAKQWDGSTLSSLSATLGTVVELSDGTYGCRFSVTPPSHGTLVMATWTADGSDYTDPAPMPRNGVLDAVQVETGLNGRQALSIIASAVAGLMEGANTGEITFRSAGGTTIRITAVADSTGRTSVTLNPPS